MKDGALWVYRNLTQANRNVMRERLCASGNLPVAILFYHRVADVHRNAWTLSCSDFSRQLDWLQRDFDLVNLETAQAALQSGHNDRPLACITFDDGYADNAEFAIPELISRGIPATYFVSTHFVKSGSPFPHDVEAGVPLRPNSIEQLQSFASQGIEIGGHTRHHPDLGGFQEKGPVEEEILGSAQELADWIEKPIRYFAFPYGMPGNTSQLAVDVLQDAGFLGFCTAYGAWNWPQSSARSDDANATIHLRRIHADPGIERLKNWLTLDPRKLQDDTMLPFQLNVEAKRRSVSGRERTPVLH